MEKAEPVLRTAGVWNEVLVPDKKKIEEVLEKLGDKEQREIGDAKKVSVSKTLRISKKKTVGEEDEEETNTE
jgi:hypothetical protein